MNTSSFPGLTRFSWETEHARGHINNSIIEESQLRLFALRQEGDSIARINTASTLPRSSPVSRFRPSLH